ncbi:MAG: TetR family transcriptional regulator [Alphaproteobacteria bacterium]|nr:TetR family transcriptional regulator [Alphaproteobacteria bacterium]MBU2084825.1 TetR family transcriptional regulator [Alphaproteobacteria bacterium]MBU2144097.1 TetR family transcriptional regulator [Alphaproteobacteria bacterium]MBU2198212.1 TetR family transcriptional regulator [Alphaproteobacteria bacterium]
MSISKVTPFPTPSPTEDSSDGRRLRSERSRTQIIDALFDLIRDGDMNPSAARVAERAAVGQRTVFRHFEDMDSLFGEMAEQIQAEVMPIVLAPYASSDWRERLMELVKRRSDVFERIFPVRVSANLRRFQSRFLMDEYRRGIMFERHTLKAILPAEILADAVLLDALDVATGFHSWRRMRQDQNLSQQEATRVMMLMVERLIRK